MVLSRLTASDVEPLRVLGGHGLTLCGKRSPYGHRADPTIRLKVSQTWPPQNRANSGGRWHRKGVTAPAGG